jgi:hypothetical protein
MARKCGICLEEDDAKENPDLDRKIVADRGSANHRRQRAGTPPTTVASDVLFERRVEDR